MFLILFMAMCQPNWQTANKDPVQSDRPSVMIPDKDTWRAWSRNKKITVEGICHSQEESVRIFLDVVPQANPDTLKLKLNYSINGRSLKPWDKLVPGCFIEADSGIYKFVSVEYPDGSRKRFPIVTLDK